MNEIIVKTSVDGMVFGALLDKPDYRDYNAEEVLGVEEVALPPRSNNKLIDFKNQGRSVKCTCYTAYHMLEGMNEDEHKVNLDGDPDGGWEFQKTLGTYVPGVGDYVATAFKAVVKRGFVTKNGIKYPVKGYARVAAGWDKNWDKAKLYLHKGYRLGTSSKVTDTNFKNAKEKGYLTSGGKKIAGHAFCIYNYDEEGFICGNSYGNNWGHFKNGTFKVRYEDAHILGGIYVLYDHKDVQPIPEWAKEAVEAAKRAGITDWSNPYEIWGTAKEEEALYKLGGLTSLLGNVSKVRWVVAAHRLGIL